LGFLTKPSITPVDPTGQAALDVQGAASPFLQSLFENPNQNPLQNALTGQAGEALSSFLGNNPEQQVFDQLSSGLQDIFGGAGGESFGNAAQEISQRNLQQSLGQLSNSAPGRFSSAFAGQGIGLAQRAQQDLTLLQQQFGQQDIANRLGAGDLLGTLAGQAGEGAFGRAERVGEFGLGQQQQLLQLLLGGLGFAQPERLDTVVGSSILDKLIGAGTSFLGFSQLRGGIGGGGGDAGSVLPRPTGVRPPLTGGNIFDDARFGGQF